MNAAGCRKYGLTTRQISPGGAMRRSRLVVLGMVAALATAACGSRTTNAQKLEALGSGRNGGGGAGNENLLGVEGAGGGPDAGTATGANGSAAGGGATGGAGSAA